MEELIKIKKTDNGQIVSARDLHEFLEVDTNFTTWCKRMFEYGFDEGMDFVPIMEESTGGRPSIDYGLTLDSAKEISMIQRSEKGKIARMYFIKCEKTLKGSTYITLPQTYSEALRRLADEMEEKDKALLLLNRAETKIKEDTPKVVFAESVTGSNNSILIRKFAKDLCDDGFEIGQNRLFIWFRANGYLNSDNEPYQNYVAQGLFEVITRVIGDGDGTFTVKTTKITGKGQVYFVKKIKETF